MFRNHIIRTNSFLYLGLGVHVHTELVVCRNNSAPKNVSHNFKMLHIIYFGADIFF